MRALKDGTPALVQPVTYTVTWNLNLDTGACQRTVRIISPEEDKEVVFGSQYNEPENLPVPTMAEATPKSYEAGIFPWEMDDIEGSAKELKSFGPGCGGIIDDTPVKGPCVRFRFENLPKDNSQFGRKTITADIAAPVHVRVFYKKLEKTNPEGKDPNWFIIGSKAPCRGSTSSHTPIRRPARAARLHLVNPIAFSSTIPRPCVKRPERSSSSSASPDSSTRGAWRKPMMPTRRSSR